MIRCIFWMMVLLLIPLPGFATSLDVIPQQVYNGGVAILRWSGPPPSFAVARFNDRVYYLYPDESGAIALLPIGLDMAAGTYPIQAAVVDRRGQTSALALDLVVQNKERPLEHLTLPKRMVSPSDPKDLARIDRERNQLNTLFNGRSDRLWTRFQRPVNEPVSSIFGKRRMMNGQPRAPHSGTDFRSPTGTPVKAMSVGRVALVQDLFYTGRTVIIDHGEGLFSLYAHLSESRVREGDLLEAGEIVGKVGSTGRATGAHLHLTVRLMGERIDPMELLAVLNGEGA